MAAITLLSGGSANTSVNTDVLFAGALADGSRVFFVTSESLSAADPDTADDVYESRVLAQCSDGLDNDSDGRVDFPADPGCSSAADDSESPDPPGPDPTPPDSDGDGKPDAQDACPTRPAKTANGCPPPPLDTTPPSVTIVGAKTLRATRKGVVSPRLLCPASEPGGCSGRVTLTTPAAKKATVAAKKKPLELGKKAFQIAGGKSAKVTIKLSKKGLALLKKRKRLPVTAAIVARDPAGNQKTTKVQLKLTAPKR